MKRVADARRLLAGGRAAADVKIGAHRSPHLYSFNKSRYNQALKEGIVLS